MATMFYNSTTTEMSGIEQTISGASTVHLVLKKMLDDKTTDLLMIVLSSGLTVCLCLGGIITNIINILVFTKQGFGDSINISLLALAIADLGSLVTWLWLIVCLSPPIFNSDLPFIPDEVAYVTAAWPRTLFSRITGWITAFITFERYLCITMPFEVNRIITPKRTQIIIAMIFIFQTGAIMPLYFTSWLVWKFSLPRNRTVLGLAFSDDRTEIENVVFIVCSMILPALAFSVIIICTLILSVKLKAMATRRDQMIAKGTETLLTKDRKTIRLVAFISTIFIICFTPNVLVFFGKSYEPEFSIDGQYKNLLKVAGAFVLFFKGVNSSTSFFLYMNMSSRFRATFKKTISYLQDHRILMD